MAKFPQNKSLKMNKTEAKKIWQMDKDHFIHPYSNFSIFKEEGSQIITGAKGMHITDADGNQFLDGIAGLWCVNIGHGRKEMADCISEQALNMPYYNPFGSSSNVPGAMLAGKLAELAPGKLNHVFYTSSGSAANDTAIRLVHYYNNLRGKPQKKKIISRLNAYHGSTYLTANLTGIHEGKRCLDRIADDWIHHVSAANMYRRPVGADHLNEAEYADFLAAELENRINQLGADNVAAFIAEPIMGAGGVLVAPSGYHKKVRKVCKEHDIIYIADEVVTAFGRLGHWFASEKVYDYIPDIMVTAKGINSGYVPLGAVIISKEIYAVISQPQCEGGVLSMGFTYSGHPVACAAALKNIEIIEREDICRHVQEVGPYFYNQAQSLGDLPIVGDVRGSHFMVGIELVSDKASKQSFPAEVMIADRIFKRCRERGLIVRPVGEQIILSPPLIMSKLQADQLFEILREGIKQTLADLKKDACL